MAIKIFQTEASKKKGYWHILFDTHKPNWKLEDGEDITCLHSECNNVFLCVDTARIKGMIKDFDGSQKLCPACVQQAYKKNILDVIPKELPLTKTSTQELQYLGKMLTASTVEDTRRVKNIIQRLTEIVKGSPDE